MSYSISVYGHGADIDKVKEAFEELIDRLDEATSPDGTKPNGSVGGTEDGRPLTLTTEQVRQNRPKDGAE